VSKGLGSVTGRLLDRLLSVLPAPPDEQAGRSPLLPDPNEPGITPEEREHRLRLMTTTLEKRTRGAGR
jgi:hypothetical protein